MSASRPSSRRLSFTKRTQFEAATRQSRPGSVPSRPPRPLPGRASWRRSFGSLTTGASSATVSDLREHVRYLARLHDVALRRTTGRERALELENGARVAYIKTIRGPVSYFAALHEIGHFVHPEGLYRRDAPPQDVRRAEEAAWAWAFRNTIIEPTWQVYRTVAACLDAYRRRRWRP